MFCKLTETSYPGVWELPVIRIVQRIQSVIEQAPDGRGGALDIRMSPEKGFRESYGWFTFSEERVDPNTYVQGAASDSFDWSHVTRTYPNKVLRDDQTLLDLRFEELAAHRWRVETGGVTVNSTSVPSGRGDRALIKHAAEAIAKPGRPIATMPFKVGNGQFVDMDEATLTAIWSALEAHVEACFVREREHTDALKMLTGQAILDYDITTGWPG